MTEYFNLYEHFENEMDAAWIHGKRHWACFSGHPSNGTTTETYKREKKYSSDIREKKQVTDDIEDEEIDKIEKKTILCFKSIHSKPRQQPTPI